MKAPAANQRRSRRNRRKRNRQQAPANQRTTLQFVPKLKYSGSSENADGIFFVTKRKRAAPTPDEIEAKKMRQLQINQRKYFALSLRHKVVNMWLHGANFNGWQFAAGQTKKIIQFLQASYPKYEQFNAAKSFVYRAILRFKEADVMPSADPFRDLRGENKPKNKRKNPRIVQLCDELLSEEKATASKVRRGLRRHGITISLSTIYRIAVDLSFAWTKPWHTDILTAAQKLKRKLFCGQLLRLTDEALLRRVSRWMFTDEKWWDLVGPAAAKYCKGATKMERKMQNQVNFCLLFCASFVFFCLHFHTHIQHHRRSLATKARKAE